MLPILKFWHFSSISKMVLSKSSISVSSSTDESVESKGDLVLEALVSLSPFLT